MIDYLVVRKKGMRSIRVRVEPSGQAIVSAPFHVPESMIMSFVLQHSHWIERQIQKVKLRSDLNPVLDWDRGIVSYLGQLYTLKLDPGSSHKVRVGKSFIYVSPVTHLAGHVKRTFLRWLKTAAETYLTQRTAHWSKIMHARYSNLQFRQQKSRWGSCTHDNRLSFNWRLIHFKSDIIDYVVIHELAHTLYHNHSTRFWSYVSKFDRTYKQKIKFLRNQVLPLEKI